ncbi:recombinase RecB [Methanocalculus taiwanensis]|uniref:Recombinase RecB n=1 Tax=Methanocalculus taiwanensis TaxID=106207 RepID=A0ABD4TNI0_9EURY|nr:recombinase RecB [Methanocalculus taiwanensis]MCQ1538850.1 recombinase RecB [Methanocalculus taiwanensis]
MSAPERVPEHTNEGDTHNTAGQRYIPISTLVRTSVCPVRVYLERYEVIMEPPEYTVAKQVGYHLNGLSDADTETIWEEIRLVRPDIDDSMKEYLKGCIAACRGLAWEEPVAADVSCTNSKYGISGRIDWIFSSKPLIGILRATRAPTYGVWKQDRIRAAAYLLAAEEMAELNSVWRSPPSEVRIAYIPSGVVRTVAPTASDRRSLLAALRKAEAIYCGKTPQPPPDAPCDRCPKRESCTRGAREPQTLFDRFFRK